LQHLLSNRKTPGLMMHLAGNDRPAKSADGSIVRSGAVAGNGVLGKQD